MTVLVTAPILLTMTLLVSGLAKLGQRDITADAMVSLRLPARSWHPVIATVLPVAEIVLALGLWVPVVPLQTVVAGLIAVLMVTYLVIIARALTVDEAVECSCFGTLGSPTVSRGTLYRNVLLSVLGLLTVALAAAGDLTRILVYHPLALLAWVLAVATAVVLTGLALGGLEPETGKTRSVPASEKAGQSPSASGGEEVEQDELLDYERAAIPAGVLQERSGELFTLRRLSARQAVLLVFVSEGCGPCERVIDQVAGWHRDLSAYMQVKVAFSRPVEQLRERTTQRVGEHVLYDPQFSAREALGGRTAPCAVLLGADGLLAGGPVTGGTAVIEFVDEIREQLRLAQEDGELPAAPEDGELPEATDDAQLPAPQDRAT
ncbi:TlpA family protein disulfide reductase [Brachybacterium sp. GCM10030267]|uniref:TlpA family protein disulfide reductase n=1 Tax=Brachybacterium sp. GCM10030267 TaxID=3273381 RepID=UPI003621A69D